MTKKFNYELNTDRLKQVRISKGISQKDMASHLGLKASNLSKYENLKETIPIENFNNICNYLEISFDYALRLENTNTFNGNKSLLDKNLVGKRLKEIRNNNNLYQETLAMDVGTSKSLISEYEHGKKLVSLNYGYAICKKYKVSMDYLYGKKE